MKNIETMLSEIGVTIPEDKRAAFAKDFAANYKTVAEYEKLKGKHDGLEQSLSDVQGKLKAFGEMFQVMPPRGGQQQFRTISIICYCTNRRSFFFFGSRNSRIFKIQVRFAVATVEIPGFRCANLRAFPGRSAIAQDAYTERKKLPRRSVTAKAHRLVQSAGRAPETRPAAASCCPDDKTAPNPCLH